MLISTLRFKSKELSCRRCPSPPRCNGFCPRPRRKSKGATVGAALALVFASRPALRGYVLDDQGALRRHVAVYVNGQPVHDRVRLTDPVGRA